MQRHRIGGGRARAGLGENTRPLCCVSSIAASWILSRMAELRHGTGIGAPRAATLARQGGRGEAATTRGKHGDRERGRKGVGWGIEDGEAWSRNNTPARRWQVHRPTRCKYEKNRRAHTPPADNTGPPHVRASRSHTSTENRRCSPHPRTTLPFNQGQPNRHRFTQRATELRPPPFTHPTQCHAGPSRSRGRNTTGYSHGG